MPDSSKRRSKPKSKRSVRSVAPSPGEAAAYDREYWLSRTPQERMQALEELRKITYGYGNGKPYPKFEKVIEILRIEDLR